jgi:hypothetical protein
MWRIFETYAPGDILLGLVGGLGTFFFGLKFGAAFTLGVAVVCVARFLDTY